MNYDLAGFRLCSRCSSCPCVRTSPWASEVWVTIIRRLSGFVLVLIQSTVLISLIGTCFVIKKFWFGAIRRWLIMFKRSANLFLVQYSEIQHNGARLFHDIPSGRNSGFKVSLSSYVWKVWNLWFSEDIQRKELYHQLYLTLLPWRSSWVYFNTYF